MNTKPSQSSSYWDTEQLLFFALHPSLLIVRSVPVLPYFKAEKYEEELGGFKNGIWHIQEITEKSNKLVYQLYEFPTCEYWKENYKSSGHMSEF